MLQNLHVKNIALIDETEVDFGQGLNILTGETGAGKSILLGSVGLALGGKYSSDLLRNGAENGLVELTFSVDDGQIRQKLEEMDIRRKWAVTGIQVVFVLFTKQSHNLKP